MSTSSTPGLGIQLASAAAWSPNPKKPPLYLDMPTKDGQVQQDVVVKWTANAILAFKKTKNRGR